MNFLACATNPGNGLTTSSSVIKEGDCVIVYEGMDSMKAVYVTAKGRFENRFGIFKHESWIGKPFGCKVTSNKGANGWVLLLRPTPELWTQVLRHRTQILYLADISMVVMHLDLQPGSVVLESGTGSGSLTHSLVRAVAPTGHVHTFEFHAGRAEDAAAEFKQHGLSGLVTVTQRNIEELGFPDTLHGAADGVFLDLPAPHKVVPSAAACLRPNGRFCSFSPCIEQVQRTAEALSAAGFTDVITYECLLREYEVAREHLAVSLQLAEGPMAKRRRTDTPADAKPEGEAAAAAAAAAGSVEEAPQPAEAGAGADAAPAEAGEAGAGPASAEAEGRGGEDAVAGGAGGDAGASGEGAAEAEAGKAESRPSRAPQQEERQQQQPEEEKWQARRVGAGLPAERMRIVSCRPSLEARGHTGYLIFARKFVCG
ncbi:hypothetical protein PLESTB_001710600 [Pleodorina starrii]|uniref:tRNA (adenine(58)-N(1))-methyltransferase n=1 Tax=Pleodorina starrii TaxID=330485 RepID=A0A9W6F9W8_9CHLO|nr:hypothetical protein PLESTB_001710600 [Pleodorina starrii]GLC75851.1 hypothetical protein PLESTF_001696100 [Pleodorina starrii]